MTDTTVFSRLLFVYYCILVLLIIIAEVLMCVLLNVQKNNVQQLQNCLFFHSTHEVEVL